MIDFHAEHWVEKTIGREALVRTPVELSRDSPKTDIEALGGFTIDGKRYKLLGVDRHLPASRIMPGEMIGLWVDDLPTPA